MRLRFVTPFLLLLVFIHLSPLAEAQDSLLYKFTGEALGDMFGTSVSGAGDVNADGYDDLIIGAPGNDAAGSFAGRAYVHSGKDSSLLYMFTGATDHDFFGTTVSGAGDVNNDGYDDLIIGAPQSTGTSHWGTGIAYVYSGFDGSLLYTFAGEAEHDRFGWAASGAGDVNNDNIPDVIVGAPHNDAGGTNAGRVYVFYGGSGPFPTTIAAADADIIFTGYSVYDLFGNTVDCAGDVNIDGHDDIFIGAYVWKYLGTGPGKAYVYSGLDSSLLYSLIGEGEPEDDKFGCSVSGAGDLNNDGIVDFVVGAYRNSTAGHYAGRAYAFYGRSEPFPITINAADADLIFTGENAGDQFGGVVSIAGDINNDGYDDIVVGANGYDNCIGRVYIYSGVDGALLHVLDGEGETEYDQFGGSVSDAGDVNNDGLPDVIIGARNDCDSGPGKAYVYSFTVQKDSLIISLDIKPGSCPNPLNVKKPKSDVWMPDPDQPTDAAYKAGPGVSKPQAVLPVAILGTADFDVANIDPATITLEGVPPLRWAIEDVSTPVADSAAECECTDAGPDGYPDLTIKFDKSSIVAALGVVYDGDTIPLTISGQLIDGTPFEGTDCVVILGSTGPTVASTPVLNVNYPNPFNPVTQISFSLPDAAEVSLEIYNIMGQQVATIVDGPMEAGTHTVQWDGSDVASGIYFYRLQAGNIVETKKMVLLK